CKLNRDIKYYKQFIVGEITSKEFFTKIKKEENDIEIEKIVDENDVQEVMQAKEHVLREPIYAEVNREFKRYCEVKKKKNPNWYSLYDGPEDFQILCKYLQNTLLYEFHYRKYSEHVH